MLNNLLLDFSYVYFCFLLPTLALCTVFACPKKEELQINFSCCIDVVTKMNVV
jgi:hypothetical protein